MVQNRRSQLAASRGLNATKLREKTYCREVRPVVSSTQRYYNATKKAWKDFMSFAEADIEASVRNGADLPEVPMVKRFLEWYAGGSRGQLGEYVTLSSTENFWHRFATCFARWTGKQFPEVVDGDMLGYIRGSLRTTFNLQDIMKDKGYADEVDIDILNTQLFHHNFDGFFHDRTPIEMAFLLHLHLYLGSRPGSFLPNQDYSDLYLRYRHVTLTLDKRKDGTLQYEILIEQESMKGKKRRHAPLIIHMYEEPLFLHCPVTLLLALAFADDAFEGISSHEKLHAFQLQGVRPTTITTYGLQPPPQPPLGMGLPYHPDSPGNAT